MTLVSTWLKINDYSLIEFRGGLLVFGGVAEPWSLEIRPAKVK